MGHYISYIKAPPTEDEGSKGKSTPGKWIEINDSIVNTFNPSNIEQECFGGNIMYEDDYDWEKRENSKSAYLLIYEKIAPNDIEIVLDSRDIKRK